MTVTFYPYHGRPEQKEAVFARLSAPDLQPLPAGLIAAFADGPEDIALAHANTGFPLPLLRVAEAIHKGLPPADANAFVLALADAAPIEAEISDVAATFLAEALEAALAASSAAPTAVGADASAALTAAMDRNGESAGDVVASLIGLGAEPPATSAAFAARLLELLKAA